MDSTELFQDSTLIEARSAQRRKFLPILVIIVVILAMAASFLTELTPTAPSVMSAAVTPASGMSEKGGTGIPPAQDQSGLPTGNGGVFGWLARAAQVLVSFIALLASIGELAGVKVRELFGSDKPKTIIEDFPFIVFREHSALVEYLFPNPKVAQLSDRDIAYFPQIREQTDAAFQHPGWLLIRGRSKTGKTREAVELLRRWWYTGPTVLVARSHVALKPPFKIPADLPTRNLVLFFDDVDRYLGDNAALKRFDETLQFFQTVSHGRDEVRVLATARQEDEFWYRLNYLSGQAPWNQFALVQLDPLSPEKAAQMIRSLAHMTDIEVSPEQVTTLAEKNDGTFLNLALAFRGWLDRGVKTLNAAEVQTFEGVLKSAWRRRYLDLARANPLVNPLYAAVDFLQARNLPLRPGLINALAGEMALGKTWQSLLAGFDRLQFAADRSAALNWYRDPRRRGRGWALIIAGSLLLFYLLTYAFLRYAPGNFQSELITQLPENAWIQLLCLSPLWMLLLPFSAFLLASITRHLTKRRAQQALNRLIATEVPTRGEDLRPYENQFEGNGRPLNGDARAYAGPTRRRSIALRLAGLYLDLAEQCRLAGEISAARGLAQSALAVVPDHPGAQFVLGKTAYDAQEYSEAIAQFGASRAGYGRSNNASRVLEWAALSQLSNGNPAAAEAAAREALAGISRLPLAPWVLGLAQYQLGKPAEGERSLRGVLARKRPVPAALIQAIQTVPAVQAMVASRLGTPPVKPGTRPPHKLPVRGLAAFVIITGLILGFVTLLPRLSQAINDPQTGPRLTNAALRIFPGSPSLIAQRGWNYYLTGQPVPALADFNEALRIDPNYALVYRWRGRVQRSYGEYEQSIQDFDSAIRILPDNPYAYTDRGYSYFWLGENDLALADFDRAVLIDPREPESYIYRGYFFVSQREYEKAVADYSTAIRLDPQNAEYFTYRAAVYAETQDSARATADLSTALELDPGFNCYDLYSWANVYCLTAAIQRDPTNAALFYSRARQYYSIGRYPEAIADFSRSINLNPSTLYVYLNRAQAYFVTGQTDLAASDIRHSLLADPNSFHSCDEDNAKFAILCYTEAVTLNPQNARAYYLRGNVQYRNNQADLVLADYTTAIQIDPAYPQTYLARGGLYEQEYQYEEALADYTQSYRLYPAQSIDQCGYSGSNFKVIACSSEILRQDPANAQAYSTRGMAYSNIWLMTEALADLNAAVRLDPQNAIFYKNRAQIFSNLGNEANAVSDYITSLRIENREITTCSDYYYSGAYAAACYEELLRAQPGNVQALLRLGDAYASIHDQDKARAAYAHAFEKDPGLLEKCDQQITTLYRITCFEALSRARALNVIEFVDRGDMYGLLEEYDLALADYHQAFQLDPGLEESCGMVNNKPAYAAACITARMKANPQPLDYLERGEAYRQIGAHEEALSDFSAALDLTATVNAPERDTLRAQAYYFRGLVYAQQQQYQQSLADFAAVFESLAALGEEPDAQLFADRGDVYLALGQMQAAATDYNTAIQFDPRNAQAYTGRGQVNLAVGEAAEALEDFTQVLEISANAGVYIHRARAFLALGESDKAIADCETALRLDIRDTAAYQLLAEIFQSQGKDLLAESFRQRYDILVHTQTDR